MTIRRQIVRLLIIVIALVGLGFGVRELYYFRTMERSAVMVKVEIPELIQQAPLIVRGTVQESIGTDRYHDPAGELVVGTRWKLDVSEVLKGEAPDTIIVRTLGGRHGLTVLWVEDEVVFSEGESTLLFLEPDPSGKDYRVVDNYQGHFTLQQNENSDTLAIQQESGEEYLLSELTAPLIAK